VNRLAGLLFKHLTSGVRYREWRTNRVLYIVVGVILVIPWALEVMMNIGPNDQSFLRSMVGGYALETDATLFLGMGLVALFGIGLMWNDRGRGALEPVLDGPVSRRAVLVAKMWFSSKMLVTVYVVISILMLGLAWSFGIDHLMGPILLRSLFLFAMQLGIVWTALAVATAIGSVVFAAMAMAILAVIPLGLGSLIVTLVLYFTRGGAFPYWSLVMRNVAMHLSAVAPTYPTGSSQILFAAAAMVWAVIAATGGLFWWERAPQERFHEPFAFPWLWNLFYGMLAIITALVGGLIITVKLHSGTGFAISAGCLAVIGWFFWRWIVLFMGRSPLRWGPGAEVR